jgi:hypothetical protein
LKYSQIKNIYSQFSSSPFPASIFYGTFWIWGNGRRSRIWGNSGNPLTRTSGPPSPPSSTPSMTPTKMTLVMLLKLGGKIWK